MTKSRIMGYSLFFLLFIVFLIGSVSADNIYDEKIDEGAGYQINNYFIEVSDISPFEGDLLLEITMYQLKPDGTYQELTATTTLADGKRRIKYKSGNIEILLMEKNITSQYARVDITTSGFVVEYKNLVEGGVSNAEYVGEPSISLTKEVDKPTVEIGDIIRVTIKAQNTGSGPAKRINVDPGITPDFIFKSNIFTTYPTELEVGNTYTQMYIYEIQAATSGTFTLNPAKLTYYSSVFDREYTSPLSNSPVVTVKEEPVETSELQLKVSSDKTRMRRAELITFTVYVNNLKDVPATAIKIEPVFSNNITYVSGSEEIDIISGKPIIQESSYGARYENDYKFTFRPDKIGSYNMTVKLTYYNGVKDITTEMTSDMFIVEEGKYDYLAEIPIYVYLAPIIIIIAIAGWLYWRSHQFKI